MIDYESLGWGRKRRGDFKGAIEAFNKAIDENHRKKYFALHGKGECLIELDRYDEAIECFNAAIGIDKDHPWAYHGLGRAYFFKEQYETAKIYLDKSLQRNTNSVIAWRYLGKTLDKMHRYDDAVKALRESLYYVTNLYYAPKYREDMLSEIESEINKIVIYKDALETDNEQLKNDAEQLEKEIEQLKKEKEQLEKENEQLEKEIQELKKAQSSAQVVVHGVVNAPITTNKGGIVAMGEAIVNRSKADSSPEQDPTENEKRRATKCETEIEDGEIFCNDCGSELK